MEKLIITAATTGNITLPIQKPYLPLPPHHIIDDVVGAAVAGAASVHIHGRNRRPLNRLLIQRYTWKSLLALRPEVISRHGRYDTGTENTAV